MFSKLHYNAPVILTYTVLAFVATLIIQAEPVVATPFLAVYRSPLDILFVLRLFTHVLGHISFEHFTGNFMLILLIGPMLEEKYGWRVVLGIVVITALVTGLINIVFFESALMGASGVVFAFIIISSLVNLRQGSVPITFLLVVVLYIGREISLALFAGQTNISHLTHIIGGVCGAVMGLLLAKRGSDKTI